MLDGMTGKWMAIAAQQSFHGQPIADMTRDELLAVIGWMVLDKKRTTDDIMEAVQAGLDMLAQTP